MLALIEPHYPRGEGGRPAYPLESMLRVHLMQNWFGYSDPAMEEALYETTLLRQFAGLNLDRVPDESTILNFRRLLERHGTIVDATIIHAQSSTKNQDGKRAPEMRQTRKGNQYYVGMKAHIGSRCLSTMYRHPGILDFSRTLVPFQPEDLGGCTVTPVPLQHSRLTFGYVFERGGKRCAYLTDTVGLPSETAAWLRREPLDLLVLDCSHPPSDHAPRNHNDLTLALETVHALPVRRTVLTHIGHELDAWLMENENALPAGVEAGHDGRVVEV